MPFIKAILTTPARHSSVEMLSDGAVAISRDEIVPAIYPGQPMNMRWQYAGLLANLQPGAMISATILSKNKLTELAKRSLAYVAGGVSEEVNDVVTKDASVYRLGDNNRLVLSAGISGVPASLDESSAPYAVVEENLVSGFKWNVSSNSDSDSRQITFAWKESYAIGAIFTNISQWITLNGTATLLEAESSAGPWSTKGSVPIQLTSGRITPLTFPDRKQDWGWIAPVIWLIYGDHSRQYFYCVEFHLADEFGNTYVFRTDKTAVVVAVSDRKWGMGIAATAAAVSAMILSALSWLITPVPGSLAAGIASGLGAAAVDPPKPSEMFRTQVALPKRVLRSFGPQLEPLAAVMAEASLCARLDKAMYRIESRYLGAVRAKNADAVRLHRRSYGEATRQMTQAAARLSIAFDAAQPWLRSQKNGIDDTQARKVLAHWSRRGLRNDTSAARRALDPKTAKLLQSLVRSPELMAQAMEGLEANLGRLRGALLEVAAYAGRDRLRLEPKRRSR